MHDLLIRQKYGVFRHSGFDPKFFRISQAWTPAASATIMFANIFPSDQ
jgi:hypothetical protein